MTKLNIIKNSSYTATPLKYENIEKIILSEEVEGAEEVVKEEAMVEEIVKEDTAQFDPDQEIPEELKGETVHEIRDPETNALLKVIHMFDGKFHGEMITYDTNEKVSGILNYKEGVLEGEAKFFADGNPLMFTNFKNGLQEGEATVFADGKKNALCNFVAGKMEGPFTAFDPEGHIVRVALYSNNLQNGECSTFYPDGTLLEKAFFKDGKLEGEVLRYYPSGILREKVNFVNGEECGLKENYNTKGKLEQG